MEFQYQNLLWLLLLLIPLMAMIRQRHSSLERYFNATLLKQMRQRQKTLSRRTRNLLLLGAIALGIVALARPIINNGEIKVESNDIDIMVGFDISHSMFAEDIYPNRFDFAKRKFDNLLEVMPQARIGVIGFSSRAFLISPLTKDRSSLRFLVNNMKFENMSLKGTDILSALEVTDQLIKEKRQKALLLFTDGGDKEEYHQEITYAKEHGITVFIYAIGTAKGGIIKTPQGVLKDQKGDIVVVKLNEKIKALAIKSNGAYLKYSIQKDDIKALAENIQTKFKTTNTKEQTIKDTQELFIYPLMLSILLLIFSLSSLPRRGA
jgi:Ca-activated chloride channel family protein